MTQFLEKEQISGLIIFDNEEDEIYEMKRQILKEYNDGILSLVHIYGNTEIAFRANQHLKYYSSRDHFIHQELGNIWLTYNTEMKIINIIYDSLDTKKQKQMLNANVWFIDPNHLLIKCGWDPKINTLKIVQSKFIVDEEALKKLINKK
jgi:hypothetical protein